MLSKLQSKREEGFTIIEVLIVLAIAGLIMLIVFLAVPALQRNQRNNGRNNDASRIAAAISECLANRNGNTDLCDSDAEIEQGTMSQLTGTITEVSDDTYSATQANIRFNRSCQDDGTTAAGASTRSFVVLYHLEPASDNTRRCLSS